jgi:6-phosphogluconolactonase
LVQAVYLEDQQSYRLTITAALINKAHAVAFLVYGQAKAAAVYQVLKGDKDTETYPAQLIVPEERDLHWLAGTWAGDVERAANIKSSHAASANELFFT